MKKNIFILFLFTLGIFLFSLKETTSQTIPEVPSLPTSSLRQLTSSIPIPGIPSQFGGRITKTKALRIEALEFSNHTCLVPGRSIQVRTQKGNLVDFVIPAGVRSRSGHFIRAGQSIIGRSGGFVAVTCTFNGLPPVTQVITLPTITLFATSR